MVGYHASAGIRDGAQRALENLAQSRPLVLETPVTVEMDSYYSYQADIAALIPTIERVGDRTIRYQSEHAAAAYRTFLATNYITRNLG